MIPIAELQEHARTNGVPLSTIERDYAQNWFNYYTECFKIELK